MLKSTDELCKKLFEKIKPEIDSIEDIEKLPKTRNEVFLIKTLNGKFFAKIYVNETFNYVEELLYIRLKNSPYIKKICCIGMLDHRKYLVTEFSDGKTLLDRVNEKLKDSDINYITVQLLNFIRTCMEVKVFKFGRIERSGEGSSSTWSKWLSQYLSGLKTRTKKLKTEHQEYLSQYLVLLSDFFETCGLYFDNLEPKLILVDLNLTNFLIREANELLILDLESFWHGDPLLTYGDWLGNTFLTPLEKSFSQHWGLLTPQETQIIHAYALLSNVSALIFISEHGNDIFQSSPWGNTLKYVDLIPRHVDIVKAVKKKSPETQHLSIRNQVLGSQTQSVLNWTILHKRTNHFIKMVRKFCNKEFKRENKNFFVIIYGSYAYKMPKISSDLDIMFICDEISLEKTNKVVEFVTELHNKFYMRRDDEIPYEKKALISYAFFLRACSGEGIYCDGRWFIPPIEKNREYLSSDSLLLRFIIGLMANPHIFVDGNYQTYQSLRKTAVWNLVKALVFINDVKTSSSVDLLKKFCQSRPGRNR